MFPIAAGKGVGSDAYAFCAIVNVRERAIGVRDFVSQGGFACFAFADDEHFGFVKVVGALGGELSVVINDCAIALLSNF